MYIGMLKTKDEQFHALRNRSTVQFVKDVHNQQIKLDRLREIFGAEDFEILMAYLLTKEPEMEFKTENNFILNMLTNK